MGTLHWQLQDCWVAASWASMGYQLRYKAAHCLPKRFYAPLLGSVVGDGVMIQLWPTSDIPAELEGTYVLEAWSLAGRRLQRIEDRFSLPAQASPAGATTALGDLFGSAGTQRGATDQADRQRRAREPHPRPPPERGAEPAHRRKTARSDHR